jgi:phosphoadenosine phosphosulfate reductase
MPEVIELEPRREIEEMEQADAEEILRWALQKFGQQVALASSFGAEDMVLVDMLIGIDPQARIFTLDTGRLPHETYELIEEVNKKYNPNLEIYCPNTESLEKMVAQYGPNLFYRGIDLRKLCCKVRKIEPLNRALADLSAWICGLRREQSVTRTELKKIEVDKAHGGILKINPLADWTEKQVWDYIKAHDVPYNKLHDKGYPSIGCAPCTRAVKAGEDIRAGRWWWESPEEKECGLHCQPGCKPGKP